MKTILTGVMVGIAVVGAMAVQLIIAALPVALGLFMLVLLLKACS